MQEIYFLYDGSGNIIAVYGNPQPDLELTAIAIDDPKYKAWYDAQPSWLQTSWPTPVTAP